MTQNTDSKTLIIFDLVSTLTDAGPRYAAAFAAVCGRYGVVPPRDHEVLGMLGNKNLKQITAHFAAGLSEVRQKAFMNECNSACDSLLYDVSWVEKLYPGVRDALKMLGQQGYALGIYTGTREDGLAAQLRYHNIGQYFTPDYIRAKNNERDGFIDSAALKSAQLADIAATFRAAHPGGRIIVIGDSAADLTAAKAQNMEFIGFAENGQKAQELGGAAALFSDYAALPGLLAGYAPGRVMPPRRRQGPAR